MTSKLRARAAEWELRARGVSFNSSDEEERSRLQVSEKRIRTLEQQKEFLIAAFQKQLKLIDLLQKQKV